ncbi:fimbria/pilus outer membrane usher protein [Pantoea ananatis]|uniref:fimbria/pilus outer membrane usher protein n=1 Tax=Pantoea ananas TaxID=553 RepID=UPI003FA4CB4E
MEQKYKLYVRKEIIKKIYLIVILFFSNYVEASLKFDKSMISDNPEGVADLAELDTLGKQLPGNYNVDVYLNGKYLFEKKIKFISVKNIAYKKPRTKDKTGLMPCLTLEDLNNLGLNLDSNQEIYILKNRACIFLADFFPKAYTKFNFKEMRLDLSIPQAFLSKKPLGWIQEQKWDSGINALLLGWQYSGNKTKYTYDKSLSQYLNLNSGINIGSLRFRDNSIWTNVDSNGSHWQKWEHVSSYMLYPISNWKSNLLIGNSNTEGTVFEPISFDGAKLSTDLTMYPDTMQGFAPVVRGVANSNAEVSILQNGNLVYRTSVPPGAFIINDLYSVSNSGDLQVRVKEANGSIHSFIVPYSSVPVLQRKGSLVYSIATGKIRNYNNMYERLSFIHGTFLWGIHDNTTIYGGTQLAKSYKAVAIGAGKNIGDFGAFSADVTTAKTVLSDNKTYDGESLRFLYSRSMSSLGTSLQILANRFSSSGYYSLPEAALNNIKGWRMNSDPSLESGTYEKIDSLDYYDLYRKKKNLLQANITQRIGTLGSLFLTASRQTYWGMSSPSTSAQAGFSGTFSKLSYQISLGYSKNSQENATDKNIYFSFSIPLETLLPYSNYKGFRNTTLSYSMNKSHDDSINQIQINGTALDEDNLSWGLSNGYGSHGSHTGDASLDYLGTYGGVSLGYGKSDKYSQIRYGARGGFILSKYGLTAGQQLGRTNILVAAPGASGVPVDNTPGIRTDWRGYAIKTFASDYRENRIALDISELDSSTDIVSPVKYVIPTNGAVVLAKFDVRKGQQSLITLYHKGKKLPFGTIVSLYKAKSAGIVDESGEVYLSGLDEKGKLIARWGNKRNQQCIANYDFTKSNGGNEINQHSLKCTQ